MSFLSKLGGVLLPALKSAAPTILSVGAASLNPALGPIVSAAVHSVIEAEETYGTGAGAEKLGHVTGFLNDSAAAFVRGFELATGRRLVDEKLFQEALQDLAKVVVKFSNAFGLLPKS